MYCFFTYNSIFSNSFRFIKIPISGYFAEGEHYIRKVYSIAEKEGILVDDRIKCIGEFPVYDLKKKSIEYRLKKAEEHKIVNLTILRNIEVDHNNNIANKNDKAALLRSLQVEKNQKTGDEPSVEQLTRSLTQSSIASKNI